MIAVDAMGGDYAPYIAVKGAYNAAKKGIPVALYGQQPLIVSLLTSFDAKWQRLSIKIVHCTESIAMSEEPSRSVIAKKDSSIVRAMQAVAQQEASAFVSAGHSGAVLVSAIFLLGKTEGVLRPALATFLPTNMGQLLCLDLGANTDCKPEYLKQFAIMGYLYSQLIKGIDRPRVALLSNGSERYKGSQLVKEAYVMLEHERINFHGNIEAKEVFDGYIDVLVCDGFSGNILLKAVQGSAHAIKNWLRKEYESSWFGKIVGFLSISILKKIQNKIDYKQYGGAFLLGVKAPVVVAHGSSDEVALENSIILAHNAVKGGTISRFNYALAEWIMKEKAQDQYHIDVAICPKKDILVLK